MALQHHAPCVCAEDGAALFQPGGVALGELRAPHPGARKRGQPGGPCCRLPGACGGWKLQLLLSRLRLRGAGRGGDGSLLRVSREPECPGGLRQVPGDEVPGDPCGLPAGHGAHLRHGVSPCAGDGALVPGSGADACRNPGPVLLDRGCLHGGSPLQGPEAGDLPRLVPEGLPRAAAAQVSDPGEK